MRQRNFERYATAQNWDLGPESFYRKLAFQLLSNVFCKNTETHFVSDALWQYEPCTRVREQRNGYNWNLQSAIWRQT
jgi:hypothetical protein